MNCENIINKILSQGNIVSVWDGERWQVKKSNDFTEIMEVIDSVEESQIKVRTSCGDYLGWELLIPSNGEDDICDWSDNDYMNNLMGAL